MVFNADERGLNWKLLQSSTLTSGAEQTARNFKVAKDRVTVLVCVNTGKCKIPLTFIHKYAPAKMSTCILLLTTECVDGMSNFWGMVCYKILSYYENLLGFSRFATKGSTLGWQHSMPLRFFILQVLIIIQWLNSCQQTPLVSFNQWIKECVSSWNAATDD